MNLFTLPEWKENYFPESEEGENWKYAADKSAAKSLYNKWREVFQLVMAFTDTLVEEDSPPTTRDLIYENAMLVAPKIISAAGDTLYIIKMENASIIRTNCRQLMDQVIFAGLTDMAEKYHENIIRQAMDEFRVLFKEWAAMFEKDEFEDEWGLY